MVPVISVILIITVSLLVTKIATVILVQTGLSQQAAKFQARSALTGTGFTTHESESVTRHPVRRKIVLILMLVGNAGIVTVMASLLLTFVNHDTKALAWYYNAAILVGGIALIWILSSLRSIDRWLICVIERLLCQYTNFFMRDYMAIHKLNGQYQISEYFVMDRSKAEGNVVSEVFSPQSKLLLLGIEKNNGKYIGHPGPDWRIETGDKLIIYGEAGKIREFDSDRKE